MIKNKQKKGFSLIEILITVAIISILVITAIPSYLDYIQASKVTGLLKVVQKYQINLTEYITTTGDTICSQPSFRYTKDTVSNQPLIEGGMVGNGIGPGGSRVCSAFAIHWDFFGPGNFLILNYIANVNSDRSITWQCKYSRYFAPGSINQSIEYILPDGCTF